MDLNELNFDNIGIWPWFVKLIFIVISFVAIIVFGIFMLVKPEIKKLDRVAARTHELKQIYEAKQYRTASVTEYKKQLVQMRVILTDMLKQLTMTNEIPALVEEISKIGAENGLNFKLIKPGTEVEYDFYAERPIEISVTGSYHDIASFISDVAQLQKIITFNDFIIKKPINREQQSPQSQVNPHNEKEELVMDSTARIYRYTERKEGDDEQ